MIYAHEKSGPSTMQATVFFNAFGFVFYVHVCLGLTYHPQLKGHMEMGRWMIRQTEEAGD